ncbi:MAG: IS30 family transposase [Proteobacteria bacterium]|nr:IS30 family transposase [Pseudomonadota bacterium]
MRFFASPGSSADFIKHRVSFKERPLEALDRQSPGHWETDLMLFSLYGQAILTLHERTSRLLIAARPASKAADPIAQIMAQILEPIPKDLRQTITFDNGTEFAHHYTLNDIGIRTFFYDTRSPRQKGGVENAIGRMRRTLPGRTDLAKLDDETFTATVRAYNNTPRKCLDYNTPAETFCNNLLHFECESTAPPARE